MCLEQFQEVHVVLGNEACDLDSMVSSLVYAFSFFKVIYLNEWVLWLAPRWLSCAQMTISFTVTLPLMNYFVCLLQVQRQQLLFYRKSPLFWDYLNSTVFHWFRPFFRRFSSQALIYQYCPLSCYWNRRNSVEAHTDGKWKILFVPF